MDSVPSAITRKCEFVELEQEMLQAGDLHHAALTFRQAIAHCLCRLPCALRVAVSGFQAVRSHLHRPAP